VADAIAPKLNERCNALFVKLNRLEKILFKILEYRQLHSIKHFYNRIKTIGQLPANCKASLPQTKLTQDNGQHYATSTTFNVSWLCDAPHPKSLTI
jgi:hypothetical protein